MKQSLIFRAVSFIVLWRHQIWWLHHAHSHRLNIPRGSSMGSCGRSQLSKHQFMNTISCLTWSKDQYNMNRWKRLIRWKWKDRSPTAGAGNAPDRRAVQQSDPNDKAAWFLVTNGRLLNEARLQVAQRRESALTAHAGHDFGVFLVTVN